MPSPATCQAPVQIFTLALQAETGTQYLSAKEGLFYAAFVCLSVSMDNSIVVNEFFATYWRGAVCD